MGDPPRALGAVPGLRSWAAVLLVVLAGFAVFAIASAYAEQLWDAEVAGDVAAQVHAIESILPQGQRTARAVVIIGTSLTRSAIDPSELPDQFRASVQLVVVSGMGGTTAPVEDLVPVLLQVHPDLVLLESNLVRRPPPEDSSPLVSRARHLEWAILASHNHFWAPVCTGLVGRKSAKGTGVDQQYQTWFSLKNRNLARLPLLAELKANGIQVGVLDMPRATELEKAAPNLLMWRNLIGTAATQQGIGVWSVPGYWPVEYFCDLAHVNHQGALVFEKWFTGRVDQALNLPQ